MWSCQGWPLALGFGSVLGHWSGTIAEFGFKWEDAFEISDTNCSCLMINFGNINSKILHECRAYKTLHPPIICTAYLLRVTGSTVHFESIECKTVCSHWSPQVMMPFVGSGHCSEPDCISYSIKPPAKFSNVSLGRPYKAILGRSEWWWKLLSEVGHQDGFDRAFIFFSRVH